MNDKEASDAWRNTMDRYSLQTVQGLRLFGIEMTKDQVEEMVQQCILDVIRGQIRRQILDLMRNK